LDGGPMITFTGTFTDEYDRSQLSHY